MKDKDTQRIMFVFVRNLMGRIRSETCNSSYCVGNSAVYSFKNGKWSYTSHCCKQSVKEQTSSSINRWRSRGLHLHSCV